MYLCQGFFVLHVTSDVQTNNIARTYRQSISQVCNDSRIAYQHTIIKPRIKATCEVDYGELNALTKGIHLLLCGKEDNNLLFAVALQECPQIVEFFTQRDHGIGLD